ncbi:beta-lactamase-like protein [Boletus edulis BED1]|uniref:Beta-lactamase-like protein n=1 Tax=Boletus edulis BED1 TaxID=1328754 RepID=A0AAD4C6G7_BOLED|nr:beta-lactamase-like protein [Boletus edulis BED1]
MAARRTLGTMDLCFLGTASAQPSSTRNHSAIAFRLGGDVWLFDCGEATQHRLQKSAVKMGRISKIFITHTHGDHIFGLLPLMASIANGAGGTIEDIEDPRTQRQGDVDPLEIYGPLGTRAYVRAGLAYTYTLLGAPYVVHELRFPTDPPDGDHTELPRHTSELPSGRNIPQVGGVWKDIFKDDLVSVSAAPILHSVPCVGYVIQEAPIPGKIESQNYIPSIKRTKTPMSVMSRLQQGESVELSDGTVLHGPPRRPGRKIVILGDTYDPSAVADIACSPDLLVHEATNAHLPGIDPTTKPTDTFESIEARAKSRGHSTPQMAAAFATRIGARRLVLNHFSPKYPGNDDVSAEARTTMEAIADLARKQFTGEIICARDLLTIEVKLP